MVGVGVDSSPPTLPVRRVATVDPVGAVRAQTRALLRVVARNPVARAMGITAEQATPPVHVSQAVGVALDQSVRTPTPRANPGERAALELFH